MSKLSVWQRIGRGGHELPPEIFNMSLLVGCTIFGIIGAARGFDEGNVSGMLASKNFQKTFDLVKGPHRTAAAVAATTGNISAMVQLFSILGGLGAFLVNDRIGRVWTLRALCVTWIVGVVLEMTAHHLPQLYAGRAIAGVGIGATTVVGPVYLVEVAPKSIRGLCSGMFSGFVYLGIMLSYFATYGSQLHQNPLGRARWVIPLSLQIMFAALALTFSIFAVESPRYLMLRGNKEKAMANLTKLRRLPASHDFIVNEMSEIEAGLERERAALEGKSFFSRFFEIIGTSANRFRLIGVGLMIQVLGQWSGANSITIYAPQYFALLGVTGQNEKLFATAIFGVVKLIASLLCAFFLVDKIGRKRSLYCGLGLQFLSMLYIAIFLGAAPSVAAGAKHQSATVRHASTAGIVAIYINGFGWALGWNSVQYLINTEIFPLHLRSLGASIIMAIHFANQYGNSKAVPTMLLTRADGGLGSFGTMLFFSIVCLLGLIYIYFFLPETSGHSLESLDLLFNLPWWKVGRQSQRIASRDTGLVTDEENLSIHNLSFMEKEKADGDVVMLEHDDHPRNGRQ